MCDRKKYLIFLIVILCIDLVLAKLRFTFQHIVWFNNKKDPKKINSV